MFKDISTVLLKNKVRHDPIQLTDALDRRIYRYSLAIIIICSAFITNQYVVNNSIHCHAPVLVGNERSFVNYLNNYGWVHLRDAKLSLSQLHTNNDTYEQSGSPSFAYYYWMPFILMFQAFMVWFPHQLWDYFCKRSTGRDYIQLVEKARKNDNLKALYIDLRQMIEDNRKIRNGNCWQRMTECFRMRGSKVSIVHSLIMTLCWIVSVGQLFFMMSIFGYENPIKYTNDLLIALSSVGFMKEAVQFPRMIYLRVPDLLSVGKNINLVAQCFLPMNMVIEKIILVLSLWFLFVTVLQTLQFLSWIFSKIFINRSRDFIMNLLRFPNGNSNEKRNQIIDEFTKNFLQRDGVFIIRMIHMVSGPALAGKVTLQMYKIYREQTLIVIE